MPIATVTFQTPLAMHYVQQMAREFTQAYPDRAENCSQIALPGGGTARLQASEAGFTVTPISEDPEIIARSKRLIEGYFEQIATEPEIAPAWIDSDA